MEEVEKPSKKNILIRLFQKDFAKFPLDEWQENVVLQAMVEFAQRKCAEQRSLCAMTYQKSDWVETKDCTENILNAEEPTYE